MSTASDFGAYLLYRGETSDFTPGPGNLVASQPDTGYVDDTPMPYYKLAAEDVHGNVGPHTLLQLPVAVGVGGPAEYALALVGARPNPAVGRKLQVRFILPRAGRAELELLDVTGRRVEEREVGSLGPGPHEVDLDMGRRLAPGIYLVRLTQGHHSRTTRVAVLN